MTRPAWSCSLAYQLSQNLPAGYGEYLLGQEVDQNCDPGSLFDRLLVQPLAGLPPTEQPLLIIIDGLDEAADPIEGNPIAKLLSQRVGSLPAWLRLLVTSRSHPQVTEWLQGVNPVELVKTNEDNLSDLRAFIQEALLPFNGNQQLSERVVQKLLEKSEGVFLYIEYIRKDLQDNKLHLNAYRDFPKGLNGMYKLFFERQFTDREIYSSLVRPALQLAAAAYEALPLTDIAEWLGWTEEMRLEFEEQAGGLFNLQGERLAAPHRTLLEWVSDRHKAGARFWANPAAGRQKLVKEGWQVYQRGGAGGVDGYLLRRLPFHLLAVGKGDDLAQLLGDLMYLDRLYDENKFLLFEAWGGRKRPA